MKESSQNHPMQQHLSKCEAFPEVRNPSTFLEINETRSAVHEEQHVLNEYKIMQSSFIGTVTGLNQYFLRRILLNHLSN